LSFPLTATIDDVKNEIQKRHALKPQPTKQKIFFAGRLLASSTDTLEAILAGVRLVRCEFNVRKTLRRSKSFISLFTQESKGQQSKHQSLVKGQKRLKDLRPKRKS